MRDAAEGEASDGEIGSRDEGWAEGWVGIYDVVMEALTGDKILGQKVLARLGGGLAAVAPP